MNTTRILLLAAIVLLGEPKCFGQPVVWSGNGDGTSWTDAQNWVGQQVPGPTSTVFITNLAGGTVIISSDVTVESILCSNALTISSGWLMVTNGASSLQGTLTVSNGGLLLADGGGTTLTSGGLVNLDGANLRAAGGAIMSLPGVSEYNQTISFGGDFTAAGAGSVLSLPGMTNITGMNVGSYYPLTIYAFTGGEVSLGEVTSISNTIVQVSANGTGSEVDLSALREFYGYMNEGEGFSQLGASQGGTVLLGHLGIVNAAEIADNLSATMNLNTVTNLTGCTLVVNSNTVTLPNVVDIDDGSLLVIGGGMLSLPGVVEYSHTADSNPLLGAMGLGSVLMLPGLTNLTGTGYGSYNPLMIQALAGGMVSFDGLVSFTNTIVQAEASGSGSELDLPALRGFYGYINVGDGFSQLQDSSGGTVLVGQLGTVNAVDITVDESGTMNLNTITNLVGSTLSVTNGVVTLPNIADIDNASLYVIDGATLSLPGVLQYDHTADSTTVFQASGSGSVLTLAKLTNVTGMSAGSYNPLMIQALAGGMINLDGLISATNTIVQAEASGSGSELNLSAMRVFEGYINEGDGYSQLQASGGGTVLVGQLGTLNAVDVSDDGTSTLNLGAVTNLSGTTLTVTNGVVTLSNVVDIDNTSLFVSGGATLSLPGVVEYDHSADSSAVFQASGSGSVLALAGLASMIGTNEGSYNPFMIQALAGGEVSLGGLISSSNTIVQVEAIGNGSEVDMSQLHLFSGYVDEGEGFSQLQANNDGTVLVGQLGTVNEVDITDDGTGTLNLGALTNLNGSSLTVTNSAVTLTNLADIDNSSLYVNAGSSLSLPGVVGYTHSADSFAVFQASGSGTVLTLPALTNLIGTNAGSYNPLTIQALAGGMVNLNRVISSSNAVVQVEASGSGSEVNLASLRVFYGFVNEGDGYSELQATGGATVLVPHLGIANAMDISVDAISTLNLSAITNLSGSTLILSGGAVTLSNLVNIDGAGLLASGGATLSLPSVRSYIDLSGGAVWEATNAGSIITLPGLTNLTGASSGFTLIEAVAGGQVLLGNLQTIASGGVDLLSDGAGSAINLTSMSAFVLQSGQGSLTARNGGAMLFGTQPLLVYNVAINIPVGNPIVPPVLAASETLTLCATAWHSYRVEVLNALNPASVLSTFLVPMTNSFETVAAPPPSGVTFLVTDFVANPPLLTIELTPDNEAQVILFGLTNATYQVQSTTSLHGPLTWTLGSVVAMTNAFRIFPEAPLTGTVQLYRAEQQ